ncbi:unnamed protein product [Cuscuta campestris]|uniref:Uncharacterized protein n=1 Tax=Cuscuta campestris TaxID=132261 RepID=A0A484MSH8_9ASTE|nr:unnamed protein product [Cuscuta campestris]
MGSAIERTDTAVQRQGYAMQVYFDRVNYVPPLYQPTFLRQDYTPFENNESYIASSSPDDEEIDEDVIDVELKIMKTSRTRMKKVIMF